MTDHASETVQLLIDNDHVSYDLVMAKTKYFSEHAEKLLRQHPEWATREDAVKYYLADWLKDRVETWIDLSHSTFKKSLLVSLARVAFEHVNWHWLADHYIQLLTERTR